MLLLNKTKMIDIFGNVAIYKYYFFIITYRLELDRYRELEIITTY